jgi:hypothetical protein
MRALVIGMESLIVRSMIWKPAFVNWWWKMMMTCHPFEDKLSLKYDQLSK